MSFDWKKTIGAIAPMIGTAIGGPFGGLASSAITSVLGIESNSTDDQIADAVKNATPEQLAALKQADNDFKLKMRELDLKEDDLIYQDKDSAREREVKLGGSWVTSTLACMIMLGFFLICGYVLGWGIKEGINGTMAGTVIGYAASKAEQVASYYFGSSRGSKEKTAKMMGKN